MNRFIIEEQLPNTFQSLIDQWYRPLFDELLAAINAGKLSVLGVTGTQGSGKSTLAKLLQCVLQDAYGRTVVSLSMDDFYLRRADRKTLATLIHPLLATRGVPGTHDVDLMLSTIDNLLNSDGEVAIPRFDKSVDDRKPQQQWDRVVAPVDLVIIEGWCVCAPPQCDEALIEPINELERDEDSDGTWRRFVNNELKHKYKTLFGRIDQLIMLQAPNFEAVYRWRGRQEQKLKTAIGDQSNVASNKTMNEQQLRRFIQHYERLTRECLAHLPATADVVFTLNEEQIITERINNP